MGPIHLLETRQLVPTDMRITPLTLGYHGYDTFEMFRLGTASILMLGPLLLPTTYRTSERDRVNCIEGLCIVLRRLSFPSRWKDLVMLFGRSKGSLSRIFIDTMQRLLNAHGHLLNFTPAHFLHRLGLWAAVIAAKGVDPALGIAMFIDGTLRGTCQPNVPKHVVLPPGVTAWQLQAALFSGHKWKHGLKYQGVNAPNCLIIGCYGPRGGYESDCKLLADSGICALFYLLDYLGTRYRLFGDAIYPLMHNLMRPFLATLPNTIQSHFNDVMAEVSSPVRVIHNITTIDMQ
jgi:hypothetical protein